MKSILQVILLCQMTVMALLKGVSIDIIVSWRSFLWHDVNKVKKHALMALEKLCLPKKSRGLGLRDLVILSETLGVNL